MAFSQNVAFNQQVCSIRMPAVTDKDGEASPQLESSRANIRQIRTAGVVCGSVKVGDAYMDVSCIKNESKPDLICLGGRLYRAVDTFTDHDGEWKVHFQSNRDNYFSRVKKSSQSEKESRKIIPSSRNSGHDGRSSHHDSSGSLRRKTSSSRAKSSDDPISSRSSQSMSSSRNTDNTAKRIKTEGANVKKHGEEKPTKTKVSDVPIDVWADFDLVKRQQTLEKVGFARKELDKMMKT